MKQRTRTDIQGLRALAVILVILFHLPAALSLRGGFVGVDMFFVISGFVVTNMVITGDHPIGRAWGAIGSFLRRRVMRLIPAASVVIVATIIIALAFAPTVELAQVSKAGVYSQLFISNLFYASNFNTYWDPAVLRSPFLHTWSLGVEFQVYLIFPLLFLAIFRGNRGSHRGLTSALIATLVLGVISLAAFVYLLEFRSAPFHGFAPGALAFYSPFTRFWEFALGIVPAIIASRGKWSERVPSRVATPLAWVLLLAGVVGCTLANQLDLAVILSCVGVAIMLANGARSAAPIRSALDWKPLVWIGDRSYSIYLWHWPLLVLALWLFPGNGPIAIGSVGVTVALSILTFRFVEQRFRRPRSTSIRTALLPSVAFVAAGVLIAGSGVFVATQNWYQSPVPIARAAMRFIDAGPTAADMDSAVKGCVIQELQITCENVAGAPRVVIIGDSLGYRSVPAVQLAAMRDGFNTTMMWTGGCSIELDSCPSWMYDYLAKTKVAALIVNVNYDRASTVINGNEVAAGLSAVCPRNEPVAACPAHVAQVDTLLADAPAGLRKLEKYTDKILVALPFPQQSKLVGACLSPPLAARLATAVDAESCGRTSLRWQRERQGLFESAIAKVTSADPHVTLWDPTDLLCTAGECPAVINGGDQIMSDAIHLTWAGSRLLYPRYSAFVDAVKSTE